MEAGTFNLNHFESDNSCFEIDTVHAEAGLQREELALGKKLKSSNPRLCFWRTAHAYTSHKEHGLHRAVLSYLIKLTLATENRIWGDISAKDFSPTAEKETIAKGEGRNSKILILLKIPSMVSLASWTEIGSPRWREIRNKSKRERIDCLLHIIFPWSACIS